MTNTTVYSDPRVWEWLRYYPVHLVEEQFRNHLSRFQRACKGGPPYPNLPTEILQWLLFFPLEEAPQELQPWLQSYQTAGMNKIRETYKVDEKAFWDKG